MPSIKIVSGPPVYLVLFFLGALVACGAWVITQPMLEPLGAAKYAVLPVYFVLAMLFVVPMAASLFVFGTILFAQISLLRMLGIKKPAPLAKAKPIEYLEYDDETRGYVKKSGYF